MNSGTTSTELNDMLTDFVNYVDSFYGLNDPIYPMTYKDTGLPLTKVDILGATEKYLSMCSEPLLPYCTWGDGDSLDSCLLYTSPSPRDLSTSRMPSSA